MSTSSSSSTTCNCNLRQSKDNDNIAHSCHDDIEIGPLCGVGSCAESIMRLFSSSKRKKDNSKNLANHQGCDEIITQGNNDNQKKKKKSFLKRLFKSKKKQKKGGKQGHTAERDQGDIGQSPTLRSVTDQNQQLILENELFKDTSDRDKPVQEVQLNLYSSLHAPLSDYLLEGQEHSSPKAPKQSFTLEAPSSPLPIYRDDDDDDSDFDNYQNPSGKKASLVGRQEQHAESLDVTQELSFSSSLSIWTKNSAVKKSDDGSHEDFRNDWNSAPDSPVEIYRRDSELEESEEEKTFNGLFEEEVHALEDTLSQILSLSDQDSNSSKSLSRHDDDLPLAPPESPPHSSLILPNLSPIKPSRMSSPKSTVIPVVSDYHESNSLSEAPQSPPRTIRSQLDALPSTTPTASSPVSPLQLKQRTKQFAMDNVTAVNNITRGYHSNNDEEASMSTNNSVYLDCVNHDDNADAQSNATSIVTADGEICKNLLVQFDNYSNQYSLGLQIRNLVQERDELLANQQKERELHQANYKQFCEKIQRLEQTCHRQREQRQSLVEQLAHQSVLHRQSVLQLSMLRKQQEDVSQNQSQEQLQIKDNPWAELTASVPSGEDLSLEQVQQTVQLEGAAILDRFLLDDQHREQLEQQLEDSLNERHQLIAKFGQELGIQLARYRQLEERFKAEQTKYNRQVSLNAQLEQQVFHLQQNYDKLEEKYHHLQDWQAAIIRKHERQQKRVPPVKRKDQWTSVLGELGKENEDEESDIQVMEA